MINLLSLVLFVRVIQIIMNIFLQLLRTGLMDLTINKEVYIANCILNVHNLEQAAKRCEDGNNKGIEAALALKDIFS